MLLKLYIIIYRFIFFYSRGLFRPERGPRTPGGGIFPREKRPQRVSPPKWPFWGVWGPFNKCIFWSAKNVAVGGGRSKIRPPNAFGRVSGGFFGPKMAIFGISGKSGISGGEIPPQNPPRAPEIRDFRGGALKK